METITKIIKKILNGLIIIQLGLMVIVVFLNVVLRYVFDSGITWSEELSRYLFVWVIFLGAIVAFMEKGHLGIDLLVGAVPRKLQKIFFMISNLVVIAVLILCCDGLIKMMQLDMGIPAPATGLPINLLPLAGVIASILIIISSIIQTVRFVFLNQDSPPWVKDDKSSGGI